jgi:hypothetical protein
LNAAGTLLIFTILGAASLYGATRIYLRVARPDSFQNAFTAVISAICGITLGVILGKESSWFHALPFGLFGAATTVLMMPWYLLVLDRLTPMLPNEADELPDEEELDEDIEADDQNVDWNCERKPNC